MASYVVKAQFEGSLRRFSSSGLAYERLESQVRDLFKIPTDARLVLTYADSDGDVVTMAEDADLHDALVLQSLNPLRLKATVLKKEAEGLAAKSEAAPSAGVQERKQIGKEKEVVPEKAGGEERKDVTPAADLSAKTDTKGLDNATTTASAAEGGKGADAKAQSETAGVKALDATDPEDSKQPVHFGIVCDDCRTRNISGTRYKSLRRYDYDLCEACFQKLGVDGNDYIAIKKARPDGRSIHFRRPTSCDSRNPNFGGIHRRGFENPINRRGRPRCGGGQFGNPRCGVDGSTRGPASADAAEVRHHGVTCDECRASPITGPRFKSTKKFDYDLCQSCVQKVEGAAAAEYVKIDRPRHEENPYMVWKSNYGRSPGHGACPFVRYGRPTMSPRRVFLMAVVPPTADEMHGENQEAATVPAAGEGSNEVKQAPKTAENLPEEGKIAAGAEEKIETREVDRQDDDVVKEKPTSGPVDSANAGEVKPDVEQKDVAAKKDAETESVKSVPSNTDGLDVKPSASNVLEQQSPEQLVDEKKVVDGAAIADDWDPILEELQEMGFYDSDLNRRVLSQNNGSMKRTVKELVGIEKMGQSKAPKGDKEE